MNVEALEALRVEAKLAVSASIAVGNLEAAAEQLREVERLDEEIERLTFAKEVKAGPA